MVGVPRQGRRAGRAVEETFRGAAWQRCAVHPVRDCARAASGPGRTSRRVPGIVAPVFRLGEGGAVRAAHHLAIGMPEGCCPEAARILEEAGPDAPAYLDLSPSHRERLRTNNLQGRTDREIGRRSRVVQVFPSVASLERLAGAVMCDRDEAWSRSRYFSERVMSELPDEPLDTFRLVARRAIEASLELADELEAAWHRSVIDGSGQWPGPSAGPYTNFLDTTPKEDLCPHLKECELRFNMRGRDMYKFMLRELRKRPLN